MTVLTRRQATVCLDNNGFRIDYGKMFIAHRLSASNRHGRCGRVVTSFNQHSQFLQCLFLDLPNAFARDAETFADFFKGSWLASSSPNRNARILFSRVSNVARTSRTNSLSCVSDKPVEGRRRIGIGDHLRDGCRILISDRANPATLAPVTLGGIAGRGAHQAPNHRATSSSVGSRSSVSCSFTSARRICAILSTT